MTLEYGMSWSETMKGNATVASLEHVANGESVVRRAQAASWDPFEVWLTRIKQPRDSAVKSASARTSNGLVIGATSWVAGRSRRLPLQ
jgi:hypothetical protein